VAKEWYVLRVQSGKEDQVCATLERRVALEKLEDEICRVLVPTESITEIKGGRKRVKEQKIYPGYVMIEMELTDESWYLVRETPGIGDFICADRRPIAMSQGEVDQMLGQAERKEEEEPKLVINFKAGDTVKIQEGPFVNQDGVVEEVDMVKGLVTVVVTIFGRATRVEDLEYWQVDPV